MALIKSIVWNNLDVTTAYLKVIKEGNSDNKQIVVAVYSCKKSRDEELQPLYYIPVDIDDEAHGTMFCEAALKQSDVTAKSQSYEYLKTLPEFESATDLK